MLRQGHRFQRWLRLVVWVVSLALAAGLLQGIDVSAAHAETTSATVPCPVTDNGGNDSESRSTDSTTKCIDGWYVNSRSKLKDVCLRKTKALKPAEVYTNNECGGAESNQQVEFIAQARGIERLDVFESGTLLPGISPTLQWEVQQPKGPNDLIRYKLNKTKQVLELVEYKVDRNQSTKTLETQVSKYETNWLGRGTLERSPHMASQLFGDVFRVDTGRDCPNGGPRIVDTFITEGRPDVDGVVMIRKVKTTDCNNPGKERDIPKRESEDKSLDEHWWDPILLNIGTDPIPDPNPDPPQPGCTFFCVSQAGWLVAGTGALLLTPTLLAVLQTPSLEWIIAEAEAITLEAAELAGLQVGALSLSMALSVVLAGALLAVFFDHLLPNVFGDPHLTTLDGLAYDLQSVGEFDLVRSDAAGLDVQARLVPAGGSTTVSVPSAYAFDLNGYKVQVASDGNIRVDGKTYEVPNNNYLYFGSGSALLRTDDLLTAIWPGTTDRPMFMYKTSTRSMRMYLPDGMRTTGLLGNHDGIKGNDLRIRNGAQLAATASPSTIHGAFADSWRIAQTDSLFAYGAGESTQTFTDSSRPSNLMSVDDFSQTARDAAEAECRAAGVLEGATLRACIYDRLVSDSDDFLSSAVDVTRGGTAGTEKDLDAEGHASEDYESDVPANFNYGRMGSDPTYGKFAGPFKTTDSYGFSAHSDAPHAGAQVSFDLIVIGDWSTDAEQNLKLDIDGHQQLSATLTGDPETEAPTSPQLGSPTSSGVFASGQKYWIFPVTASSSEGSTSDLTGEVKLTGSAAGRAFGVDNLTLDAQLVNPDRFNVNVGMSPTHISDGQPAAGAGSLETTLARDEYTFDVPSGTKTLVVDNKNCSTTPGWSWHLKTVSGADIKSGTCSDYGLISLTQGTYAISFTSESDYVGPYSVDLYFAPDPQEFDAALSTTPVAVSDGAPGVGAGNIETVASKDVYRFSVPAGGKNVQLDNGTCPFYGWGTTWKLIKRTDNSVIDTDLCSADRQFADLPEGDYQLEYTSAENKTGAYDFKVFFVPDPQVFDVALSTTPEAISDGVPAAGAGNIETIASTDVYRFTVPTGGKSVQLDNGTCPYNNWGTRWLLIDRSDGSVIDAGLCSTDKKFTDLPAGDYQLEYTSAEGKTGAYDFKLFFVPDPQVFDVMLSTTPLAVSDGVPGVGAGNIETIASRDVYRFTVPAGGKTVQLDNGTCPYYSWGTTWKLINRADNSVIDTDLCSADKKFTDLPAGDYQLEYTSAESKTGAYDFKVFFVPDPQVFDVMLSTTPLAISNGVPSAGAGNIETIASKDVYRFTVPSGGQSVQLDNGTCPYYGWGTTWKLINRADNSVIDTDLCSADKKFTALPAGNYQLEYTSAESKTGPYDFKVFFVIDPQVFDLSLSTTPVAISNGVPGAGAGNIETIASKDVYRFTVPSGGKTVQLDNGTCPDTGFGTRWTLINRSNGSVVGTDLCYLDKQFTALPAGDYQLEYTSNSSKTGAYNFNVFFVPDPQVFDVSLSTTPLAISDGVPGAGAGNIETIASKDIYRFTVPSGGRSVQLDNGICPDTGFGTRWTLINRADNSVVGTDLCYLDKKFTDLPGGDYQLEYTSNSSKTGAYNFKLFFVPDPQVFDVTLSTTPLAISDGVPGTGAGNIETIASKDVYRFTVPAGGKSVQLDNGTCPDTGFGTRWTLINRADNSVVGTDLCYLDKKFTDLPAGDYQLEYTSNSSKTGTYNFNVFYG